MVEAEAEAARLLFDLTVRKMWLEAECARLAASSDANSGDVHAAACGPLRVLLRCLSSAEAANSRLCTQIYDAKILTTPSCGDPDVEMIRASCASHLSAISVEHRAPGAALAAPSAALVSAALAAEAVARRAACTEEAAAAILAEARKAEEDLVVDQQRLANGAGVSAEVVEARLRTLAVLKEVRELRLAKGEDTSAVDRRIAKIPQPPPSAAPPAAAPSAAPPRPAGPSALDPFRQPAAPPPQPQQATTTRSAVGASGVVAASPAGAAASPRPALSPRDAESLLAAARAARRASLEAPIATGGVSVK